MICVKCRVGAQYVAVITNKLIWWHKGKMGCTYSMGSGEGQGLGETIFG